ncbi:MAG: nucleotidyltransferase domain-containing protein [Rubrivivax sp.]
MPPLPTLDQIRSLLKEHLRPCIRSILFANATAEGFANDTSDIDVLLITEDSNSENETYHQAWFGDKRIDFHAIRSPFLTTSVQRLMLEPLNSRTIVYLHRIYSALPIDGAAYWSDLIDEMDLEAFRDKVTWFHFNRIHLLIEDLEGNYREADRDSALSNATLLLACALDAFMASVGKTNPRAKWRVKQLRLLGPDGQWILDQFLDLCHGPSMLDARTSLDRYLSRVTQFTHWLQMAVIVHMLNPWNREKGRLPMRHTFDEAIPRPDFRAVNCLDRAQGSFALFGMGKPKKIDLPNTMACLGAVSGVGQHQLEEMVIAAAQSQGREASAVAAKLIERWQPDAALSR